MAERRTEPAKTRCTCETPVKVDEPDGLGPRCLMCGLALHHRLETPARARAKARHAAVS